MILSASAVTGSLGFPEGPLVLGPGRVAFVEEYRACISLWDGNRLSRLAYVGGCPNGLALGSDGRIYFTQNTGGGGWYRCADPRQPGIYALDTDSGEVVQITTSVAGRALRQPNDLCFGPDGQLYFTDPGKESEPEPGWICRHAGGVTELVYELGPSFPNGIGFDPAGRLLWTETRSNRIMSGDPGPTIVAELEAEARPDGFAISGDGTITVATLSGNLVVLLPGSDRGREIRVERWADGVVATNCAFEGSTLWLTDAGTEPDEVGNPTGRLWRLVTELNL